MSKRYTAATVLALLAALAGGAALVAGAGGPRFPPVTIPGLPDKGKCCLLRVQKTGVEGVRLFRFGDPYVCKAADKQHKVERGPAELDMILIPGDPHCDEIPNLIPKGSRLKAIGTMTRRIDDGFSH